MHSAPVSPDRESARAAIAERRGGVVGAVFHTLLERPAIACAASELGIAIRFGGCLPPALRELAICTVVAHWGTADEWRVHSELAAEAGISREQLEAVRSRQALPGADPRQQAVHAFVSGLLADGRVPASTRQRVSDLLDRPQAVELAAIAGYYSLVSFVLNTF